MTMYYVFRDEVVGDCQWIEKYWIGQVFDLGTPRLTKFISRARGFFTARAAYDAAGRHDSLQYFKVGWR